MKLSKFSIRVLTALLTLSTMGWGPLTAAQNDNPAMSSREFRASLTPNERKLPRDVLAQQRLAEGKFVPASWEQAAQTRSQGRSAKGVSEQVFRLDGESVEALESVLSQMGAETLGRSVSRGYVTASLSDDQVVSASAYAAVRRIRYVKGPTAQGVTEAWTAHRAAALSDAGQPSTISSLSSKPAITGDKVVIGLISLPYKSAELSTLANQSPRVIPTTSNIAQVGDAVDNDGGTFDLLNMLQVIYDMAPGATVVLGSPGVNSTAAEMHALIDQLVAGNGSVGSADYVPPVNIIVDDLDFLTQNPFEIDEVSEAIVAARAAGVLYVTAAGDGGHDESANSTSNVYIADFNGQSPPNSDGIYGELFGGELHTFAVSKPYLVLSQSLTDLCVFWNEDPDSGGPSQDDLTLWIF
ncbi:MAG: hypothetical protein HOH17_05800, partial [Halieaceae bacterium]|nr:hypothetical protein [Halieaceae bacterium]